MAIRDIRRKVFAAVSAVLLTVLYAAFPIYPTTKSICEIVAERGDEADRWATPHRGATLVLKGTLLGGPEGVLGFKTICNGYPAVIAVETTPVTLRMPSSFRTLKTLANANWRAEERTAPAVIVARVSSEVQSCFGPGLVVTALALQINGPVVSKPREAAGA